MRAFEVVRKYAPSLYPVRGVCLDSDADEFAQDSDLDLEKVNPGALAEVDPPSSKINVADSCDSGKRGFSRERSLFEYFLDGTRRTYLVGEVTVAKRTFLPVLGGQVSAAVVHRKRDSGKVSVIRYHMRNMLALPGGGGGINNNDLDSIKEELGALPRPISLCTYSTKQNSEPSDLAIAAMNAEMQRLEVNALEELTNLGRTANTRMLVVDGSIQFANINPRNYGWLRNVVGVSKSFSTRPQFSKDKREIGAVLMGLRRVGDRTPAFKFQFGPNNRTHAMWYLRIRDPKKMEAPLDGIVKLERLMLDDELDAGITTDMVNNLSLSVLGERYVTPFGLDSRWPTHLYPVYLAEYYQKQRLMSPVQFLRLF